MSDKPLRVGSTWSCLSVRPMVACGKPVVTGAVGGSMLVPSSQCNAGRCDMGALLKPYEMGKSFAVMSYGDLAARYAPNNCWSAFCISRRSLAFMRRALPASSRMALPCGVPYRQSDALHAAA